MGPRQWPRFFGDTVPGNAPSGIAHGDLHPKKLFPHEQPLFSLSLSTSYPLPGLTALEMNIERMIYLRAHAKRTSKIPQLLQEIANLRQKGFDKDSVENTYSLANLTYFSTLIITEFLHLYLLI